jgi:hypothetical protein
VAAPLPHQKIGAFKNHWHAIVDFGSEIVRLSDDYGAGLGRSAGKAARFCSVDGGPTPSASGSFSGVPRRSFIANN